MGRITGAAVNGCRENPVSGMEISWKTALISIIIQKKEDGCGMMFRMILLKWFHIIAER